MLLAIAVMLPAVCLLWFMTQAVKNERLAIRQKLIDSYTNRAEELFFKYPESFWISSEKNLSSFSAFVMYDQNDVISYPPVAKQYQPSFPENIHKAWKLEYSDENFEEAIKQYNLIANESYAGEIQHECQLGIVRCLTQQKKFNEAIKVCFDLAYPSQYIKGKYTPVLISQDRLMLANLYSRTNNKELLKELQNQFPDIIKFFIPAETKIFILNQLIEIAGTNNFAGKLKQEIQDAQKIIDSSMISLAAADYFDKNPVLKAHPLNTFYKIQASISLYGMYFEHNNTKMLGLLTEEKMKQFWQKSVDDFTDKLVFCRIYDDKGQLIAGQAAVEGEIFSTLNLKSYFAGWKVELYLRSGVFKEAADKKMYIYFWVASIVIVLMLSSTLLAGKAVLKQARLNKLKNDFIATITHELKTPLSSMRVLVDTLLEGRCETKQQETEYLQLISKENLRLSKLIDNFLTFSRMERNKQIFDIAPASPVEIANNAAEAMQAKFEKANVNFILNVLKPLPMINADKDAIVTVLVNLLDNAYKYSNDNKQIELSVFDEETEVCFTVKDNGIGMTHRQIKKIFDRFYQADISLSRRAEGTGLGLSIVKFIIDAHKGKIEVESKPGKESVFKIKLPISLNQTKQNGNSLNN